VTRRQQQQRRIAAARRARAGRKPQIRIDNEPFARPAIRTIMLPISSSPPHPAPRR
jgi:hypothetical protein